MARPSRYSADFRARAMRLVVEVRPDHETEWAAITSVAAKLGVSSETLRKWIRQAQVDDGQRPGATSEEAAELKRLRRENAELRQANEILKAASGLCEQIGAVHAANDGVYGVRKMRTALHRAGVQVGRDRLARLMRQLNLAGVRRGRPKRTTTADSAAARPADLVNRQFAAARPNQLWVCDLTYIRTWVLDRPNVVARMREHRVFKLQFRLAENLGYNRRLNTMPRQAVAGVKYALTRRGPIAAPVYDVLAFVKTRPDPDRPDAQPLMAPFSAGPQVPGEQLPLEREPGVNCLGHVLRPTSEVTVRITSADPEAPPEIVPNYFATEYDRSVGVAVFRRMRELFATDPIAKRITVETLPGPAVRDDAETIDAAAGTWRGEPAGRRRLGPSNHGVGQPQRPRHGHRVARLGLDPRPGLATSR